MGGRCSPRPPRARGQRPTRSPPKGHGHERDVRWIQSAAVAHSEHSLVGHRYISKVTPQGDLEFRVGTSRDVSLLSHLRSQWRSGERGERGLDEDAFERALAEWMVAHGSSHLPFLALRGDAPVAMTWLAIVDRIPGPELFVRRSAYVQSAYVVASERSRGVGTALMRVAIDHARHLGVDYVAVHPSARSFSFYRRLGFAETDGVLELRFE